MIRCFIRILNFPEYLNRLNAKNPIQILFEYYKNTVTFIFLIIEVSNLNLIRQGTSSF